MHFFVNLLSKKCIECDWLLFSCRSSTTEVPHVQQGNNHDRLSDLKIIDQMLKTYDRRATPTNKIGQPTRVECELFIRSFGSISEKTMVSFSYFSCIFLHLKAPPPVTFVTEKSLPTRMIMEMETRLRLARMRLICSKLLDCTLKKLRRRSN